MDVPFHLPAGHILLHDGRAIRFEQHLGGGVLVFRYVEGEEEVVRVAREEVAGDGLTTIQWALQEFRAGRLVDPGFDPTIITDRKARYLHLDRAACSSIDPKSLWRFDWADTAIVAGIKRTEEAAEAFIAKANGLGRQPKWRSLLRWMALLDLYGGRIGALVNASGRMLGQTQLSDLEDRLVHKWAMLYWRPSNLHDYLAHKDDAAAMVGFEWEELKDRELAELGDQPPSAECVRERINSLECYSTVSVSSRPPCRGARSPDACRL